MSDPFARGGPSFIPPSLKTSKRGRPYTNDPSTAVQQQLVVASSTEPLATNRNQLTLQQQQSRNRNNPFYSAEVKGTSQESVKFNRNRFHPLSSTKAPITLTTARTTTTASPPSAPLSSTEASDVDSNRSRLAALANRFNIRGQNASNGRSNKLLRQPLYTSRESNTPIGAVNESAPAVKKINVTHNGSSNRDANSSEGSVADVTTSSSRVASNPLLKLQQLQQQRNQQKRPAATVSDSDPNNIANSLQSKENESVAPRPPAGEGDKGDKLYDDELDEYEEYDDENDTDDAGGYEDDAVVDDGTAPKKVEKSESQPVILTSNFFLPGATTTTVTEFEEPISEEKVENETQVVDNDARTVVVEGESDAADAEAKAAKDAIVDVKAAVAVKEKEKEQKVAEVASNPPADVEYEYEYEYEDETTPLQAVAPTTKPPAATPIQETPSEVTTASVTDADYFETTTAPSGIPNNEMVTSIVTTKSVINGSTSTNTEESITKPTAFESETIPTASPDPNEVDANSTESYVVVASVQTSRSISGARFLPFPQVEQEEKKQSLSDLERDDSDAIAENGNGEPDETTNDQADDLAIYGENGESEAATLTTARPEETTIASHENVTVEEPVTDKVAQIVTSPRVHKWSSVSEKLAHLHDKIDNVEVTTKGVPVVIRKFMPRTTKVPHKSDSATSRAEVSVQQNDESSANLPPGFKFRPSSSYKNGKITLTTTTTTSAPATDASTRQSDAIKDSAVAEIRSKIQFKEIAFDSLLPKGYQLSTATADSGDSEDLLAKLLPADYKKPAPATTKAPLRLSTVTEDVSKFLPPGFKLQESASKRPFSDVTIVDDISAFLPPGFKLPKSSKSTTTAPKVATILDDISKFLPPGFKVPTSTEPEPKAPKTTFSDDISKLPPPGFKLNASDGENTPNVADKIPIKTADISSLLPPGFSLNESAATSDAPPAASSSPSFKIVFPKGIGKRPRVTTPRPAHVEGPPPPGITIRKGLPTR